MAQEIEWTDTSGLNEYATLLDATGQWWNTNGMAFETFNAANWTQYALTGTEFGSSGVYTANMPGVVAGIYNVVAWHRLGGSEAITDDKVGAGSIEWTGAVAGSFAALIGTPADVTVSQDIADIRATLGTPVSTISTGIADINAKTINLPASPAAVGSPMSLTINERNSTADALLARNIKGGSSAGRIVAEALAASRNKVIFDVPGAGQFTVMDTDDTTPLWIGTYTRGANTLGPLTAVDPS